jgi:general secretion pathway protein G
MIVRRTVARAASRRAFTLLEVLVVVAIIVVLAGVGVVALMPQLDNAKERVAKAKIEQLTNAVQIYKLNNDDYPPSLEALAAQQPSGAAPLVGADQVVDPWGQPYGYNPAGPNNGGLKPDIWATRPDRQIGNWPGSK